MINNSKRSSACGLVSGLLLGMLVGAAVSLLYAPKSGKETREELLERLETLKDQVEETTKQLAESACACMGETKEDLALAVKAGQAAAKERAAILRRRLEG